MFPQEVDFSKFELMPRVYRGKDQWSVRVLYAGKELQVQTPKLPCTFDLLPYSYPGSNQVKYSLNVTLDPTIEGVQEFQQLLEEIDDCAKEVAEKDFGIEDCQYDSPIKTPKLQKYHKHLRCKMVSNSTKFKFKACLDDQTPFEPTIKVMEQHIKQGRKIEMILQLNPIWKVNGRYGVSWQISRIKVYPEVSNFRKTPMVKSHRFSKNEFVDVTVNNEDLNNSKIPIYPLERQTAQEQDTEEAYVMKSNSNH